MFRLAHYYFVLGIAFSMLSTVALCQSDSTLNTEKKADWSVFASYELGWYQNLGQSWNFSLSNIAPLAHIERKGGMVHSYSLGAQVDFQKFRLRFGIGGLHFRHRTEYSDFRSSGSVIDSIAYNSTRKRFLLTNRIELLYHFAIKKKRSFYSGIMFQNAFPFYDSYVLSTNNYLNDELVSQLEESDQGFSGFYPYIPSIGSTVGFDYVLNRTRLNLEIGALFTFDWSPMWYPFVRAVYHLNLKK